MFLKAILANVLFSRLLRLPNLSPIGLRNNVGKKYLLEGAETGERLETRGLEPFQRLLFSKPRWKTFFLAVFNSRVPPFFRNEHKLK